MISRIAALDPARSDIATAAVASVAMPDGDRVAAFVSFVADLLGCGKELTDEAADDVHFVISGLGDDYGLFGFSSSLPEQYGVALAKKLLDRAQCKMAGKLDADEKSYFEGIAKSQTGSKN